MKTLSSLIVLALLAATSTAQAGTLVDIAVVDRDNGNVLPTYQHAGKLYVAGIPGHRYGVRIANHTGGNIMAVLSVDGVNAVSGETASPEQSGYVLGAWQSTEVDGWRKNMSEVAQFNFTALDHSYAAQTGRPNNVGVIGVAVFTERPNILPDSRISAKAGTDLPTAPSDASKALPIPSPPPAAPASNADASAAAPSRSAPEAAKPAGAANGPATTPARSDGLALEKGRRASPTDETLGTGHGAREASAVTYIDFQRASAQPNEIVSIWYDSYRNLVAKGVIERPVRPAQPQPFPNGFVPDPPHS